MNNFDRQSDKSSVKGTRSSYMLFNMKERSNIKERLKQKLRRSPDRHEVNNELNDIWKNGLTTQELAFFKEVSDMDKKRKETQKREVSEYGYIVSVDLEQEVLKKLFGKSPPKVKSKSKTPVKRTVKKIDNGDGIVKLSVTKKEKSCTCPCTCANSDDEN